MKVEDLLLIEEGYREKAYYCSEGYPTIGIGLKLGPKGAPLSNYTFTVSKQVAKAFLSEEINKIKNKLSNYSWFKNCNVDRQSILISMAYQMGISGLLTFKNTLNLIDQGKYIEAGNNMLQSKWARQTPLRAQRHAKVIISGSLLYVYQEYLNGNSN